VSELHGRLIQSVNNNIPPTPEGMGGIKKECQFIIPWPWVANTVTRIKRIILGKKRLSCSNRVIFTGFSCST
jgi:hypothetical protein